MPPVAGAEPPFELLVVDDADRSAVFARGGPAAERLAGRSRPLLVTHRPLGQSVRWVLIPLLRSELDGDYLERALDAAVRLRAALRGDAPPPLLGQIQVLHLTLDAGELHADAPRLRRRLARWEATHASPIGTRIRACLLWERPLLERLEACITREPVDLLVARLPAPGRGAADAELALHLCATAPCPVLLLPPAPAPLARALPAAERLRTSPPRPRHRRGERATL